jgi:hypothetical protein
MIVCKPERNIRQWHWRGLKWWSSSCVASHTVAEFSIPTVIIQFGNSIFLFWFFGWWRSGDGCRRDNIRVKKLLWQIGDVLWQSYNNPNGEEELNFKQYILLVSLYMCLDVHNRAMVLCIVHGEHKKWFSLLYVTKFCLCIIQLVDWLSHR